MYINLYINSDFTGSKENVTRFIFLYLLSEFVHCDFRYRIDPIGILVHFDLLPEKPSSSKVWVKIQNYVNQYIFSFSKLQDQVSQNCLSGSSLSYLLGCSNHIQMFQKSSIQYCTLV